MLDLRWFPVSDGAGVTVSAARFVRYLTENKILKFPIMGFPEVVT